MSQCLKFVALQCVACASIGTFGRKFIPKTKNVRYTPNQTLATMPYCTAMIYQRSAIHCAPTTISQTPIVATVITITAASKAIESRTPSSSR